MGNHDFWCYEWLNGANAQPIWIKQGGMQTVQSFHDGFNKPKDINPYIVPIDEIIPSKNRTKYINFFNELLTKYEDDVAQYIHGGFDFPFETFESVFLQDAIWNRSLITDGWKLYKGKTIFLGHSTVQMFEDTDKPLIRGQVINLDTGAGHGEKLTIMDRDTKEYWQSDESGFARY